jgi:hypothetical protein
MSDPIGPEHTYGSAAPLVWTVRKGIDVQFASVTVIHAGR